MRGPRGPTKPLGGQLPLDANVLGWTVNIWLKLPSQYSEKNSFSSSLTKGTVIRR